MSGRGRDLGGDQGDQSTAKLLSGSAASFELGDPPSLDTLHSVQSQHTHGGATAYNIPAHHRRPGAAATDQSLEQVPTSPKVRTHVACPGARLVTVYEPRSVWERMRLRAMMRARLGQRISKFVRAQVCLVMSVCPSMLLSYRHQTPPPAGL